MAGYWLTDEEWIASWNKIGSPEEFAKTNKMPGLAEQEGDYDKNDEKVERREKI